MGTLVVGTKLALSGGSSKPTATATPPINASSSDEADFIKCANSPDDAELSWANPVPGTSLISRTRRTRRLNRGRWLYGCLDAVYVYKSCRHELSLEPDSRIQIPTKAGFANCGITNYYSPCDAFEDTLPVQSATVCDRCGDGWAR